VFAFTVAVIAFTSLESATGLAGEVRISSGGLKRMVAGSTVTVIIGYVGIAVVAVTALPVHNGHTELATRYVNAPMIGIVSRVHPYWLADGLRYVVAALATVTLVAAANSAMLGSRDSHTRSRRTARFQAASVACTRSVRPPTC